MADWFRSWHGAPTDPKWVLIARKAGTTPAVASAIAWALFDCASQAMPRGNVSSFDCEVYAAWGGLDEDVVSGVVEAMTARGMIVDGTLSAWAKRQPVREDGSAERAKEWRERQKAQQDQAQTRANAAERNRALDTDTDTEKRDTLGASPKVCPKRVRTPYPEDFEKFWSGYPTDQNMSKKEALTVWSRLTPEKRAMALQSLPAFRLYCQSHPDYRPIHANRYLSKERFEGHMATATKLEAQRFIEHGTPQWDAWQAHLKAQRGRGSPTGSGFIDGRQVTGWTFPSEWPPAESRNNAA
jgi:hypothetical protein